MDALVGLLEMVLVCFVTHTVDGFDVASNILKLEDCESNMATRSQFAAWMDAIARALHVDFAKDTEPAVASMS